MWWKAIVNWLRERVDVEVDLDIDDDVVQLTVNVLFNETVLLAERFEWELPLPGMPVRLDGLAARRRSVLAEGR